MMNNFDKNKSIFLKTRGPVEPVEPCRLEFTTYSFLLEASTSYARNPRKPRNFKKFDFPG